ncbi:MAG: ParB/RepB/Spo0J family partition protein [Euzebyales bacterium]|jgi:ParB family chromosome partitioning protein|nr:ParB/RepB/Spo0J family partition protein [Euzebyales bacterium]
MTRQGGLGRGLSALLPAAAPGQSGLITLRLDRIVPNPRQPRERFEDAALEELAQSIREVGLLQPVLVRPTPAGAYELIAGERRFRAARRAGLDEIAAVVRHTADEQLLTEALVENLHRTDLNPLEEAAAYQQLLDDFDFTHDQLAQRLGRSRSTITNALRLLALPASLQQHCVSGALSAGHARALLALDRAEQQERAGQRVIADGLSVRATEELVRRLVDHAAAERGDPSRAVRGRPSGPYSGLQQRLGDALNTKVEIKGTERRGRIVIDYSGRDDLERLLAVLGRGAGHDLTSE